jgi:hypothetical protein
MLVEVARSQRIYFLVDKKVKTKVDDKINCSLQTQINVLEVDDNGFWTKMVLKPYKLFYSLNKQELAFSHLNHVVMIERDGKSINYSFKGEKLNKVDTSILNSFFNYKPAKPMVVFDSPKKVKQGDAWDVDSNKLVDYFNRSQRWLVVPEKESLGRVLLKKAEKEKFIVEGTTVFRKLFPKDKRLSKLKPEAAVGSVKISYEIPRPGKAAPFSSNTLLKMVYIGKDKQEGLDLELSISIKDQTIRLIKEVESEK